MLYVLPCLAQSIGDIDIFDDFDIPQQQSSSAPTSLALPQHKQIIRQKTIPKSDVERNRSQVLS